MIVDCDSLSSERFDLVDFWRYEELLQSELLDGVRIRFVRGEGYQVGSDV